MGSSPRVWGQVLSAEGFCPRAGIIPTRVGTRVVIFCFLSPSWDHPHACGDKVKALLHKMQTLGSSPRVWGQDHFCFFCCCHTRIIPTRVGTSGMFAENYVDNEDHPHACGDKKLKIFDHFACQGSSPRVWGQGLFGRY